MPQVIPYIAAAFIEIGGAISTATFAVATALGASAVTATAISAAVGGAVTALAPTLLATTALGALSRALTPPKSSSTTLGMLTGTGLALPVVFGSTAVGGSLFYQNTYAKDQGDGAFMFALHCGRIDTISQVIAGDNVSLTFDADPNDGWATVSNTTVGGDIYKESLSLKVISGESPDDLYTELSSGPVGVGFGPNLIKLPAGVADWSSFKVSGLTQVLFNAPYGAKKFPQGFPKMIFAGDFAKLYDPRKDSTYPGGSGSHRWDDQSTWEFTQNGAIQALNVALGFYQNGVKRWGLGARLEEIDVASFVHAANISDANGWKCSLAWNTDDDLFGVMSNLLASCGATMIDGSAKISCWINSPTTSLYNLTSADVIGTATSTDPNTIGARVNTVNAWYREPSQFWKEITANTITNPTYLIEDSNAVVSTDIHYASVQDVGQVHQLASYDIVTARRRSFTIPATLDWSKVNVGDGLTINLPISGNVDVKVVCTSTEFDFSTGGVTLVVRQDLTDDEHAFCLGQSATAPPSPINGGFGNFSPSAPESWSITAEAFTNSNGVSVPSLEVSGAADAPNLRSIVFEYRELGSSVWLPWTETDPDQTQVEILAVAEGSQYEVAVSYRNVFDIVGARQVLGPVTAGQQLVGGVRDGGISWTGNTIVGIPNALTDLANGLIQANNVAFSDGTLVEALANLSNVEVIASDQEALGYALLEAAMTNLEVRKNADQQLFDANGVALSDKTYTLIAANDVLVNSVTVLGAETAQAIALAQTAIQAEATNSVAILSKIDTLGVELDTNTATLHGLILNNSNAIATANSIQTTNLNLVASEFHTANATLVARIGAEELTRATNDNAISLRVDTVDAKAGSAYAAANSVSLALVTNSATLSLRIDANVARTDSAFALTNSTTSAFATANAATATKIDALTTFTGAAYAQANSITTLFNTANTATATQIGLLNTSVAGNNASILTLQNTTSSITGQLGATYSVQLGAGGVFSSFKLQTVGGANTTVSNFTISDAGLIVQNSTTGGTQQVFRADSTGVYVGNNVVATASMVAQAVMAPVIAYSTSATTPSNLTTETTIQIASITTTGGVVTITGSGVASLGTSGSISTILVTFRFYRDGTLIYEAPMSGVLLTSGSGLWMSGAIAFAETPSAGAHTYTLTVQGSANTGTKNFTNRYLMVEERKR